MSEWDGFLARKRDAEACKVREMVGGRTPHAERVLTFATERFAEIRYAEERVADAQRLVVGAKTTAVELMSLRQLARRYQELVEVYSK